MTSSLPLIPRSALAAVVGLLALSGCDRGNEAAPVDPGRPIPVFTVKSGTVSDDITLSGEIQAEKNVSLGFRIAGRVTERGVNVGERVTAGQLVARLDPSVETNAVAAAKAALEAARGEVATTRNTFERQERLMSQGFTTRPRYDEARQAQETAQARLEDAEAQLDLARDRLAFTELHATVDGVVTARRIEPGEVVQPGQVVIEIAREDGRDAVFSVPARLLERRSSDPIVHVSLADSPGITAIGRIREIAPQADPVTRTFQVRVGLKDPPEAMRLGATVVGTVETASATIMSIPAGALTRTGRSPAVWIVDPAKKTVALRAIDILRFDPTRIIVSQGLDPGELIVSGGVQALHPGQRIIPLPAAGAPG